MVFVGDHSTGSTLVVQLGSTAAASTSADLLATLVALEVFGHLKGSPSPKKVLVEAGTDNLATERITLKESSNKFPLAFIQMQLSLWCSDSNGDLERQSRKPTISPMRSSISSTRSCVVRSLEKTWVGPSWTNY